MSGNSLIVFGLLVGEAPPPPPPPPPVPLGARLPVASTDCSNAVAEPDKDTGLPDAEPTEDMGLPDAVVKEAGTDCEGTLLPDGTFDSILGEIDAAGEMVLGAVVSEALTDGSLTRIGASDRLGETEALGEGDELPEADAAGSGGVNGLRDPEDGGSRVEEPDGGVDTEPAIMEVGGEGPADKEAELDGVITTRTGGIEVGEVDDPAAVVETKLGDIEVLLDGVCGGLEADVELELVDTGRTAPTELPEEEAGNEDDGSVGRELERLDIDELDELVKLIGATI
jgi:hypothetical protein